ncbi:hypothetical protein HMPREF3293_01265 [Christensenella minuta]|uniref:Uncharacterized protein n=1 Tax=Christensenella minuta TaxID=626937 RepID=A0A136Q5M0_9FIRM|nr:hypothetical protein HMPREF3293_01265 [Christensenella minuta]
MLKLTLFDVIITFLDGFRDFSLLFSQAALYLRKFLLNKKETS